MWTDWWLIAVHHVLKISLGHCLGQETSSASCSWGQCGTPKNSKDVIIITVFKKKKKELGRSLQGSLWIFSKSSQRRPYPNHNVDFNHPEGKLTWSFVLNKYNKRLENNKNLSILFFTTSKRLLISLQGLQCGRSVDTCSAWPVHFLSTGITWKYDWNQINVTKPD